MRTSPAWPPDSDSENCLRSPADDASERRTAYALGWLAGLVVVVSFALMILHYRDNLPWHR